ncbi:unnamed protein product [Ascophyllum nodosum]
MSSMSASSTAVAAQRRPRQSLERRRCGGTSTTARHVFAGAVLVSLFGCGMASYAGAGQGDGFQSPYFPRGRDQPDGYNSDDLVDWGSHTQQEWDSHGMPLSPPIDGLVERPDPMDGIRALAIALEDKDRRELSRYVAMILQKLANMNELFLGERARKDTVFHSASMPLVAVADFVERVADNIRCPNLCLMLTLVYMDRLALPSSELHLYVTPLTAHRLFAASLIIAIKFVAEKPPSALGDSFYDRMNAATGLGAAELKHLEHHMLQALAKNAYVPLEELNRYLVNFAKEHHEVVPYVDQPYSGPPLFPFQ